MSIQSRIMGARSLEAKSKMKKPFGAGKRRAIYAMTRGRCFYCGLPLHPDSGSAVSAHGRDWLLPQTRPMMAVDHKIPQQRGGSDDLENLIPACSRCNSRKNLSTLEEYRLRIGLTAGALPHRFVCESPAVARDYIVVVSPEMARGIIVHNFPEAYSRRAY